MPCDQAYSHVFPLNFVPGKILGAILKKRLAGNKSLHSQGPITIPVTSYFFHISHKFYANIYIYHSTNSFGCRCFHLILHH